MRGTVKWRSGPQYRSSTSHTDRIIQQNISTLLKEIPNGNKYRVTSHGKLVLRDVYDAPDNTTGRRTTYAGSLDRSQLNTTSGIGRGRARGGANMNADALRIQENPPSGVVHNGQTRLSDMSTLSRGGPRGRSRGGPRGGSRGGPRGGSRGGPRGGSRGGGSGGY